MTPPEDDIAVVPVFPLPGAVLFPDTVLPLHVFEPRYRAMVRHVKDGDRRIAVALLKPGYEDEYEGCPDIHGVATVGRIEDLREESDGRFYFNLVGLERVRLEEIPSSQAFRMARALPLPESGDEPTGPEAERDKLELLASLGYLLREITDHNERAFVMNERLPFRTAVNSACANLPVEPALRQELLRLDDYDARRRRVTELINRLLQQVLQAKGDEESDGAGLN